MFPTTSPWWNELQILKNQLYGRLESFQPDRFNNEASHFENDLRYILTERSASHQLTGERYKEMDRVAMELLDKLNDIVNEVVDEDLIQLQEAQTFFKPESLERFGPEQCESSSAPSRHSRLRAALDFLQRHPEYRFRLVNGPGPSLFTYRTDAHGIMVTARVRQWQAFLQVLAADQAVSQGLQTTTLHAMGVSVGFSTENEPDMLEKRASPVVNALFKEFRKSGCADTMLHEVKLRLSALYTGPAQSILDVFVSCCPDGASDFGHEAKCGSFK
jgi:hypothetical protein